MCAYLTGVNDDYVVDEYEDDDYSLFEGEVMGLLDEYGNLRTSSVFPTEGYSKRKKKNPDNNSVIIFFCEKPTEKQIDLMKEKVKTFQSTGFKQVLGFRLVQFETTKKIYAV